MKFLYIPVLLGLLLAGLSTPTRAGHAPAAPADTLSLDELKDFGEEAKTRIRTFVDYLGIIADKNRPLTERNEAIRTALQMFKTDDVKVQVSNINTGTVNVLPLRQYLEKIKSLTYDKVEITNFESVRLSKWEQNADGSYQATGIYFQEFKAWRNGIPVYNDKTTKKIDADLRVREDPFYNEKNWMVLFGNITVNATERVYK
ncbi:hypothetical protein GCM10023187_32220 [Nibrella viscosa]|uniref:Uncharacterized protein n=1 Tax=Nibrella viscosa TaxID=1084524 RepID=A0ABP8KK99_9BACT